MQKVWLLSQGSVLKSGLNTLISVGHGSLGSTHSDFSVFASLPAGF